jgi:molybdopterin molybdotransferase
MVSEADGKATFTRPARPSESIRVQGREIRPGDLLLSAGTLLGPAQLALLAASGHHAVLARRRPRVTIISTGNELISPGARLRAGQAWESNSLMLAAAARRLGCTPRSRPAIRDDHAAVLAALQHALPSTDLLVTSGGISMGGRHDAFKAALRAHRTIRFCRVAMRPGMPQGYGTIGDPPVPILLLPGTPLSAFVSFTLFAEPAVRALQGRRSTQIATASAALTTSVTPARDKTSFLSAVHEPSAGMVTPVGRSTHDLSALAQANALIVLPPGEAPAIPGDCVSVLVLS